VREYKTKEIKKVERVREKELCDICKKEIKNGYGFDQTEINIEARIGDHYPEGELPIGLLHKLLLSVSGVS
jgi:hypothetical protein